MADISAGGAARTLEPYDDGDEARQAASRRFEARAPERMAKIEALNNGAAVADTIERVAQRADRLRRYAAGEQLRSVPRSDPGPASGAESESQPVAIVDPMLERVINNPDFVDIRFLEAGVAAARAVARVNIRNEGGRVVGYGTASMVSSHLALTNHHVLPSAEAAQFSTIEFNYQDGVDGQPLQPRVFRLDPDRFYMADKDFDFAIVAVAADDAELATFGFNRLIDAEGKSVVGEFVTIVQHPKGEKKQVSLRENRVVDVLDSFLHYETDTEPGSSGSPVFNDQWEVVALHHASVPAPDHDELGLIMNEGIRVSALLRAACSASQSLPAEMKDLFDGLVQDERSAVGMGVSPPVPEPEPPAGPRRVSPGLQSATVTAPESTDLPEGHLRFTVPVEITVRVGTPARAAATPPVVADPKPDNVVALDEAIRIDPDYNHRKGYDPKFLEAKTPVPLPTLPPALLAKAALNTKAGTGPRHVLAYHHFSVVVNEERALAFFTAVNIDGKLSRRLKREPDRWILDPRIPPSAQTGEAVYAGNDLDRGHLVRRLDPAWGTSTAVAKVANDDTFHFTNCTPQHKDFNQNKTTWASLEDYVLDNADNHDFKTSVFTGPVLAGDDDVYRGVQLPRQFWKVVVMARRDGTLSATAYLLSQEKLIEGLEAAGAEEFSYGAYRTFQVPVTKVEALTGLSFGTLAAHDPLAALESTITFMEVGDLDDIVL